MPSIALAIVLLCGSTAMAAKPNFVITIADDHGVHHSSVYGSSEFQTPNLQRMAEEGIRFDNAYVASPACAPSRAALFTGRMPYSNGVVGNHEIDLKPGVVSLLPALLEQGYEVVFHGKVGHAGRKHFGQYVPDGVKILGGGGLQQTMTLDQVETFLQQRPEDAAPLALFLGWTDTHTAWPPKEEARIAPEDVVIPPKIFDTPEARVEMTRYVEGAEDIDRRVGQTRQLIAKHLDVNNTLVVYTSDHGMPWPFAKWSLYESGIRTPLIAVWPGKIQPSSSTDAMVSWIDLMPTLIDLAGGTSPSGIDGRSFAKVLFGETDQHRDVIFATHKGDKEKNVYPIRSVRVGKWKYIRNLHPEFAYTTHTDVWAKESPRDPKHWAHAGHHWQSYIEAAKTDPKAAAFLHDYHSSPAEELYQIEQDPYEQNNLAGSPDHAAKLVELRAMVSKRMEEVGDDGSLSGPPQLLNDFALPPTAGDKIFDEVDGTVIIEMESTQSPLGNWKKRTTLDPFTGSSYLEFMGNNPGVGAPDSPLNYDFQINTPGDYWISIRSHKRLTADDGVTARSDMCNDCYVRVEGDYVSADPTLPLEWLQKDTKFWGNAADLNWKNWSSKVVGDHDMIKTVRYRFQAGKQYRLVVSGRAQRFSLDRIIITRVGDQRFNETGNESRLVTTWQQAEVQEVGQDKFAVWQPLSISFDGPRASETDDSPNPFLDYRLQVQFVGPSGQTYEVPGYFDGDGNGGKSGNQWTVKFTPDEQGAWNYQASLRSGPDVAVSLMDAPGQAANLKHASGTLTVQPRDDSASGFSKWGRLEYVGGHYLKFRDGPYWIRGGVDSPENFLAYAGFDNTPASHRYADHASDWQDGDPDWNGGSGKPIIGAINSLADQQVNSLYFLTMNIGGDGDDVWPWSGKPARKGSPTDDNRHFDLSKLRQWETVFAHAQRKGIHLHFVFNEAEEANKKELDDGELGIERKLYYREMVARFGHHNALSWNLCEEYNLGFDLGPERVRSFADYVGAVDAYDHPITVHSAHDPLKELEFTFGDPRFSMTSIQLNQRRIDTLVEDFRTATAAAGRPLPISMDEFTLDVGQDASWRPFDRPELHRRQKLWPTLLSGGQIEFILEDLLKTESFKTANRQALWNSVAIARTFMEEHLPFWEMSPADELVEGESTLKVGLGAGKSFPLDAQVFCKPGHVYAIYYPTASKTGQLDLSSDDGKFQARWYNPRTGQFEGTTASLHAGNWIPLPTAPSAPNQDWVLLLTVQNDERRNER
ncbi:Choline-sulfatase [Rhodopirellula islandica]|uniref:Choline-sulfatase n=1 Tax=Rhodopirellula islandica TaxID=595434 RepID=A0A0J1BK74_RHOIS|nr:Choline-sulfatase [Rhodopirellula islandica]